MATTERRSGAPPPERRPKEIKVTPLPAGRWSYLDGRPSFWPVIKPYNSWQQAEQAEDIAAMRANGKSPDGVAVLGGEDYDDTFTWKVGFVKDGNRVRIARRSTAIQAENEGSLPYSGLLGTRHDPRPDLHELYLGYYLSAHEGRVIVAADINDLYQRGSLDDVIKDNAGRSKSLLPTLDKTLTRAPKRPEHEVMAAKVPVIDGKGKESLRWYLILGFDPKKAGVFDPRSNWTQSDQAIADLITQEATKRAIFKMDAAALEAGYELDSYRWNRGVATAKRTAIWVALGWAIGELADAAVGDVGDSGGDVVVGGVDALGSSSPAGQLGQDYASSVQFGETVQMRNPDGTYSPVEFKNPQDSWGVDAKTHRPVWRGSNGTLTPQ